jgi:protein-disulfide isomerase
MKRLILLLSILLLAGCGEVDDAPRPFLGGDLAPVLIEEFSDLQCPACARITGEVEEFARTNPKLVRFEYYHFPLPQHQYAFKAAEGAECANDQGKFWEFLTMAFDNQNNLAEENLVKIAEKLGLETASFQKCLDDSTYRGRVSRHLSEGRSRGINATPSFYVNGKFVQYIGIEPFANYVKDLASSS